MKSSMFTFGLMITLAIGCSSKSKKNINLTTSEILTARAWTGVRNYEDDNLDGVFIEFGKDCEKDDIWTFLTNGTLTQSYGTTICDPDDDPNTILISNWQLLDNEQVLSLDFAYDDVKFKIVSISDTELVLFEINDTKPGVFTHKIALSR